MVKVILSPFLWSFTCFVYSCLCIISKSGLPFGVLSLMLGVLILGIFSTPFVPRYFLRKLERRYPVFKPSDLIKKERICILILGAGHTLDPNLTSLGQLSKGAMARVIEGVRIYRKYPESIIVTSGSSQAGGKAHAELAREALKDLGVKDEHIRVQVEPTNTWNEATSFKEHFYTDSSTVILVTCAYHMPRAMFAFQRNGIKPIPAPTNHFIKSDYWTSKFNLIPRTSNLQSSELLIHELFGLLYYKIKRNKQNIVFPNTNK